MSKPCCIVSKHCVRALNWPWRSRIGTHKWRRTPPIVTSWIDTISLTFLFNRDHVISVLNFPVNDLCHDSIGHKLFGFVFSRSDEPIVIGVCGMRSADQNHRIVSEPIASGSFLESGPVFQHKRTYTTWPSFFGRCFQKHFVAGKCLYFDSNFTQVCWKRSICG